MFESTSESISFAEFELDRTRRRLYGNGRHIPLYAKTFELLEFFLEKNGQIVTKDEILENVWPGQFVEEANLSVQVSALRKALGEPKGSPRFLITIPGKGYKFAAELTGSNGAIVLENRKYSRVVVEEEVETDDVAAARPSADPIAPSRRRSIAIPVLALFVAATAGVAVYLMLQPETRTAPFAEVKIARVTNSGNIAAAALSPDGKYIAYVLKEADGNGLWLRQIGTASDIRLLTPTTSEFWDLIFSPDGGFIYYNLFTRDKADTELFRIPTLGGVVEVIPGAAMFGVSFSPDGKQIASVEANSATRTNSLVIANTDGGGKRTIASREHPETYQFEGGTAAWSPDGETIATVLNRRDEGGTYSSIVGVRISDGQEFPLSTDRWHNVSHLEWLRDGSGLVITSTEDLAGSVQVWFLSAADGESRRLINDLNDYGWLSVAGDGGSFTAVQSTSESRLWVRTANSREFREIASEVGEMSPVVWLGDDRIVFRSQRSGEADLWSINADGSGLRQLTVKAGVDSHGMCATPDGKTIVFTSTRSGVSTLWRVGSDGENLTELTHGGADAHPQCPPDGRTVVFQRGIYSKPQLWIVPLEGGDPKPMSEGRAKWPAISPEGDRLSSFEMKDGEWHIVVRAFDLQAEHYRMPVPKNLRESTTIWASPNDLYYVGDDGTFGNIWSLPVGGKPARRITNFSDRDISGFAMSQDRTQMAVVRKAELRDVVLVENIVSN